MDPTILELRLFLHYVDSVEKYSGWTNPDAQEQVKTLVAFDLLHPIEGQEGIFTPTERGKAYLRALQNVPLPQEVFRIPATKETFFNLESD